jgi:xylulokinase
VARSEPVLLSIDLGTTSCKASLFAAAGSRIADSRSPYPLYTPEPGSAEQEPGDWQFALHRCLAQLHATQPYSMNAVAGIGLAAQMNALVLVDDHDTPLHRAACSMDQRPVKFCTRIREQLGASLSEVYIGRNSMLGRIAWLQDRHPDLFTATARLTDARGLLAYWLTGNSGTDPSSGVWSWSAELLRFLGIPEEKLPQILPAWEVIGRLQPQVAAPYGLKPGIPVIIGSGDGCCANIGVGAIMDGVACISLGATGVARAVLTSPLPVDVDLPTFSYPFMDGLWLGGGYYPAGVYLDWLGRLVNPGKAHKDWAWLSDYLPQAESIPPGADGLQFSPHIFTQNALESEGHACFNGLQIAHGPAHLLRAILEGTAVSLRTVSDFITGLDLEISLWRATGGGMKIPLWQQILSGMLGMPLELSQGDTSLGAAILAAVGIGLYPDLNSAVRAMVRVDRQVTLPAESTAAYQEVYAQYRSNPAFFPKGHTLGSAWNTITVRDK